jgi:hypothetical protein
LGVVVWSADIEFHQLGETGRRGINARFLYKFTERRFSTAVNLQKRKAIALKRKPNRGKSFGLAIEKWCAD